MIFTSITRALMSSLTIYFTVFKTTRRAFVMPVTAKLIWVQHSSRATFAWIRPEDDKLLIRPYALFSWFKVGPNSTNGSIQCLCTHLSAFGGDFLVAPNPIDFDQVWDAFSNILETKNFVVLATVCTMLGLYVIAVVFARRADRCDKQKVSNYFQW